MLKLCNYTMWILHLTATASMYTKSEPDWNPLKLG
jgi:hypothetical protein